MTELSTLERKPLSDLHQIAAQLGIEQYRKYRKPALAELIYKTATEQAVGQQTATNGGETSQDAAGSETADTSSATVETANGKVVDETVTGPAETHLDPFGEADTALEPTEKRREEPQRSRERAERGDNRRQQERGERGDGRQDGRQRDGQQVQNGILDV